MNFREIGWEWVESNNSESWDRKIWSWVPGGPKPRMSVLAKASSKLPHQTRLRWGGMDWIRLAQDRDQWRALVNIVMNLWVS
jgi:hypothetical protein